MAATSHAAPAKPKAHAVVGTLAKVDGQTITVETTKGPETVLLVSSSRIHRGASAVEASTLRIYTGQRVKVRYVDLDGGKQAQTLTIATSGATHSQDLSTALPPGAPATQGSKK